MALNLGAAYSLEQCIALKYDDSHTREQSDAQKRFPVVAMALKKGQPIERRWLAGYFFNNAVMRLAALIYRLNTYLHERVHEQSNVATKILLANDHLQNRVDAHVYCGWKLTTFEDVVIEADRLLSLIKKGRLENQTNNPR